MIALTMGDNYTMKQTLVILILFASTVIGSPLNRIVKRSTSSKLDSITIDIEGSRVTIPTTNDLITNQTHHPTVKSPSAYEFFPDTIEATSFQSVRSAEVHEITPDFIQTATSLLPNPGPNKEYGVNSLSGAVGNGELDIVEKGIESVSISYRMSQRDIAGEDAGYHNYALVCANSAAHTYYCANRRRGYYCSQNGYLNIYTDGNRYKPCEDQCVCIDIGIKPACRQVWAGVKGASNC